MNATTNRGRTEEKTKGPEGFLVLSRKLNETIVITLPDGSRIVVSLLDIRSREKARIGIKASKAVIIHRSEIQDDIDAGKGVPQR